MNRKRLIKIADFLENEVESRWFNIHIWASRGFRERKCGSAACVLGWTTAAFPRSGVRLSKRFGELRFIFGRKSEYEAGAAFYGIDSDDALYLFAPGSYPHRGRGRMAVIRRLRSFVKRGGSEVK